MWTTKSYILRAQGGTGINNGSSTITLGASLITTGAGAPTLAFPGNARTYTYPNASATMLSTAGAVFNATTSNPTGTASLTAKMMGLGSTCTITPLYSTRVHFALAGQIANNTATDGAIGQLTYGTGTAPVNGAANTGTQIGNYTITGATASTGYPFAISGIASGLTPGTAYWFDTNLAALTGGTATVQNLTCSALEL